MLQLAQEKNLLVVISLKIKTKISIGFGLMLIIFTLLMTMLINLINGLYQNTNEIVVDRFEKLKLATLIEDNINHTDLKLNELVIRGYSKSLLADLEKSNLEISFALDSLYKITEVNQAKRDISNLKQYFLNYNLIAEQIINQTEAGNKTMSTHLLFDEARLLRVNMYQKVEDLKKFQEKRMEEAFGSFIQSYRTSLKLISGAILLALGLCLVVATWVFRSITGSFSKLIKAINHLAYGNNEKLPRIDITTRDETKDIALAVNAMAQAIDDYMANESKLKKTLEEQSWLKSSIAELTGVYQGVQDLPKLAQLFITKITPLVEAGYGVIYLVESQDNQERLVKVAAYAANGEEIGSESFLPGEGLVGECATGQKTILLNDVPADYIKIKSGLGNVAPANLILLPVEFEGRTLAVIELATLKRFTGLHLILFKQILSSIGVTINGVLNHLQVQKLLEESRSLADELQSQSEELQMQQEELRSINEELQEQNRVAEEKAQELEKAQVILAENSRQLSLASKYKSEFLANMSHELRTPLNSLLILSQIIKENRDGNLTAKQVEYAMTINSAGNDLLALINDILDLSKIEAGKVEINQEEVRLNELNIFIHSHFDELANQKGINLEIRIEPSLPETFLTDEHKLKQILKNLLSNAIKFTEQGRVLLDIRLATPGSVSKYPSVAETGEVLSFAVIDSGIGIPRDKINTIFDNFNQADGTTSRKYGGTGLGLSISRELANLLGGVISVVSQEGKGSVFTFYLPLNHNQKPGGQALLSQKEVAVWLDEFSTNRQEPVFTSGNEDTVMNRSFLERKKVLIVDDDMRNVFALTTALENQHMEVIFAENGKEGLDILQNTSNIDLVLMDIMMPEMDGYETMKRIRQLPAFQDLPVIALTAKAMKGDRQKCIDAGASDYICKPVNLEQLYSLMLVWLYR